MNKSGAGTGCGAEWATRLRPGLRRIMAPNASAMTYTGTNTYLLGHERVAVIDPGPDNDEHLERILASIAGELVKIFVTHPHSDHSGLARRLSHETGAEILAHSGASGSVSRRSLDIVHRLGLGGGEGLDASFRPHQKLSNGQVVADVEWTLQAHLTPGHMANHMCFSLVGEDCLFSGDHVMGWSTTIVSPPHGDMGEFMESLQALMARNETIYYPGHGLPITDPLAVMRRQKHHRLMREQQILGCLKAGLASSREIVLKVYSDLPPALRGAAERNVLAHLLDLRHRRIVVAGEGARGGGVTFQLAE